MGDREFVGLIDAFGGDGFAVMAGVEPAIVGDGERFSSGSLGMIAVTIAAIIPMRATAIALTAPKLLCSTLFD